MGQIPKKREIRPLTDDLPTQGAIPLGDPRRPADAQRADAGDTESGSSEVFDEIRETFEDLERRVEALEDAVGIYRGPRREMAPWRRRGPRRPPDPDPPDDDRPLDWLEAVRRQTAKT